MRWKIAIKRFRLNEMDTAYRARKIKLYSAYCEHEEIEGKKYGGLWYQRAIMISRVLYGIQ